MDDKGLELSLGLGLGLPCGGSSSNPKDGSNNPSSSAPRTDPDERTSKILNDFRNFLNPTIPPQSFQAKPPTNFPQPATSGNGSGGNNNSGKLLDDNSNRKNPFGDTNNNNNPKKPKTDNSAHSSDHVQEKNVITSHISITTDEGSTADNEDVAESEADQGSTSQLASHKEEGPHVGPEIQGKMNIGAKSFRSQSLNKLSIPHSISFKSTTTPVGTPSSSSYHPVSNMIPGMGMHPMTFGYSSVQIPVLNGDTTNTTQGGGIGHPQIQSLHSPYGAAGRGGISTSDQTRGQTKQLVVAPEEGSSSQTEEDTKERASSNTFPSDYPTIKPGILADIKFGGSGTFPNLPWVSTTGPGPNGKTISGVTYKYNSTQIRIVCACHGTHMSPDEFIRHAAASENEPSTPRLASISNTSPAASAAKS